MQLHWLFWPDFIVGISFTSSCGIQWTEKTEHGELKKTGLKISVSLWMWYTFLVFFPKYPGHALKWLIPKTLAWAYEIEQSVSGKCRGEICSKSHCDLDIPLWVRTMILVLFRVRGTWKIKLLIGALFPKCIVDCQLTRTWEGRLRKKCTYFGLWLWDFQSKAGSGKHGLVSLESIFTMCRVCSRMKSFASASMEENEGRRG